MAGPVVAAAVILQLDPEISGLNDSKKLSAARRQELDSLIRSQAVSFAIGTASVEEIDRINILQATFLAMKRAVDNLKHKPDYLLVDGRDFPLFLYDQKPIAGLAIIKGDGRSAVIAAASIVAKVYRDQLMEQYAREYPEYGFQKHKGYGTEAHRQKIMELGPCPLHRQKFIRKVMQKRN